MVVQSVEVPTGTQLHELSQTSVPVQATPLQLAFVHSGAVHWQETVLQLRPCWVQVVLHCAVLQPVRQLPALQI